MARTTSSRRNNSRSGHSGRGSIDIGFLTRPEGNRFWLLLGFVLRRRAELTVITVGILVHAQLASWITAWLMPAPAPDTPPEMLPLIGPSQWALIVMTATVTVVLVVPVSRRFVIGRCWSVVTRHRMRACFCQTRTWTVNGRMPFLVWSRPSPVGERVRVWLPAGMSVKHLERVAAELAAACWAREARITTVRGQAALVVVDIVRHDPLGSRRPVTPPVWGDLDDTGPIPIVITPAPPVSSTGSTPPPRRGTAPTPPAPTTPIPAPPVPVKAAVRTSLSTTTAGAPADPPAVTGFGGVDVSDYI